MLDITVVEHFLIMSLIEIILMLPVLAGIFPSYLGIVIFLGEKGVFSLNFPHLCKNNMKSKRSGKEGKYRIQWRERAADKKKKKKQLVAPRKI